MAKKAKVEVFVTKTRRFRVNITESEANGSEKYAVTIGGQEWDKGKGKKHKTEIFKKMSTIIVKLQSEYFRCQGPEHTQARKFRDLHV
jgi:hypothetical protein